MVKCVLYDQIVVLEKLQVKFGVEIWNCKIVSCDDETSSVNCCHILTNDILSEMRSTHRKHLLM